MTGLLAAWLLFPAIALIVCGAAGLLAERASGTRLPGALLVPVGLATVMAATQLTTYWDWSAEATLPLTLLLTAAGLYLGRERLRGLRPDRWGLAAVFGVVAVFAAPVVLSGDATFAGYTVLGDTAIHFLGADALLTHGREYGSLPPSTYEFALVGYYGANAYPSGGPVTIGVLTTLAGQDVAWTFQPFLTLLAACIVLSLWELARPFIASSRLRALAIFVAGQPAMLVAYALQGSVKEVGTAWGITLVAALIPFYVKTHAGGWRRVIPLAIAAGALVAVVGLAAGIWLVPLTLVALVGTLLARPRDLKRLAGQVAAFVVIAAAGAMQMLIEVSQYVQISGGVVTSQAEVGNLLRPLDPLQKFGIWLIGDYRLEPIGRNFTITKLLIGVAVGSIVIAAINAWRRRAWGPAAYVVISAIAYVVVTRNGSPWADGKALMIVSPALLFAAALGAAWMAELKRPQLGYAMLGLLGAGVLWSNALAYHDVSVAPRERMEELDEIGERIAGQGPTLYTEFEEFAKHFLRDAAPEGPSEGYQRRYELNVDRAGGHPPFGYTLDVDRFTERYVTYYRTILQRRGFAESRPPGMYERVFTGKFYAVWQRPATPPHQLLRHLPFGTLRYPADAADCGEIEKLAALARGRNGRLLYAPRENAPLFVPTKAESFPPAFGVDQQDDATFYVLGPGRVTGDIAVPKAGRYEVWLEASTGRGWKVRIAGQDVGELRYHLNGRVAANRLGTIELPAGTHQVELLRGGGSLRPGSGATNRKLSPLALVPAGMDVPVRELDAERWRELCGMSVDWVEAVA